jgi:hypothetical protein
MLSISNSLSFIGSMEVFTTQLDVCQAKKAPAPRVVQGQ